MIIKPRDGSLRADVSRSLANAITFIDQKREAMKKVIEKHIKAYTAVESSKLAELNYLNQMSTYLQAISQEFSQLETQKNPHVWLRTLDNVEHSVQITSDLLKQWMWQIEDRQADLQIEINQVEKQIKTLGQFPKLALEGGLYDQVMGTKASLNLLTMSFWKKWHRLL